MGKIYGPKPVKLIAGFIFKDKTLYQRAKSAMLRRFGASDFESTIIDFNFTDYYAPEMGTGLKRAFISFKKLIKPNDLAAIKVFTNALEEKLAYKRHTDFSFKAGCVLYKRRVNIDPGYVDMAKLVLASTKDYSHRIYLGKGIYAEITLRYQNKSFTHWDWTYPDYRTVEYLAVFNTVRAFYEQQVKNGPELHQCFPNRNPV